MLCIECFDERIYMSVKSGCPQIDFTRMPLKKFGGSSIGRAALKVAVSELKAGAREIGGNNKGEWVEKYLGTKVPEGSPWCAAFVCYCFNSSTTEAVEFTVSARELLNHFRNLDRYYKREDKIIPAPGDIVVWWRGGKDSWQGHAGLVHHFNKGYLYTIEGNRTSKVEGFCYRLRTMRRLLGFGRISDNT